MIREAKRVNQLVAEIIILTKVHLIQGQRANQVTTLLNEEYDIKVRERSSQ